MTMRTVVAPNRPSAPAMPSYSAAFRQDRCRRHTSVAARTHIAPSCEWQADGAVQAVSRRAALGAAAALVSLLSLRSSRAWAEASSELPKSYQDTARKLVHVLQESITKDLSGAEEREVRKAAEPAQDLMRQVMSRWRGEPAVTSHESYAQLTASIAELGEYYRRAGARARMDEGAGNSILAKLAAAEEALPPEDDKGFSLLPF